MRLVILAVLLLAGCNPVQRIAVNTNAIREEAQALSVHGAEVGDPVVVKGASRIDELAAGIHKELPNVQNKPSDLMDLLKWGAIAAVLVAVVVILAQTGIGSGIKAVIGWIPRKTKADATLAASVMSEQKPETIREWVAAKRASDPLWDKAFQEAQKEMK
jgi:hypothetical protein